MRSPAVCLSLLVLAFGAWCSREGKAQGPIPYVPAKTVAETQVAVFQEGRRETGELANFRLRLDYESEEEAALWLREDFSLDLPAGKHALEVFYEQAAGQPVVISATIDGEMVIEEAKLPGSAAGGAFQSDDAALDCGGDFTVAATFATTGKGTLFSKCAPEGDWSPDAKALFIRGGRMVYDIGWVGALQGGPRVNDGKPHTVVLVVKDGVAELFVDGKAVGRKRDFSTRDRAGHVFKIGEAAPDFAGDFDEGTISNLRYWARALAGAERKALLAGRLDEVNTPDLNWSEVPPVETFAGMGYPGVATTLRLESGGGFEVREAWVQPLELVDHAALIAGWNEESLAKGKEIYHTLCVTCHGTPEKEGSLPTAPKFHEAPFKNGSDPYRMYQTLSKGFGMMVPQPQYSAEQKYAVIQYIREAWLEPHNNSQLFEVSDAYLAAVPRKLKTIDEAPIVVPQGGKPYERMDFGPALMWTYQVDKEGSRERWNLAQKGIAVRLDAGPGGVSKGRAWMIYDEDTMRVAAAYRGDFVDWRGIAFDGSHGTHTRIAGTPLFLNPDAPAWMNPATESWEDERVVGRDGRRYGPLPRDWVRYRGTYYHGDTVVLRYQVGGTDILERPSVIDYGEAPVFVRTLNVGKSARDLVTRVAPAQEGLRFALHAPDGVALEQVGEALELRIPAAATPVRLVVALSAADQATLDGLAPEPEDLSPLTRGGPSRFDGKVIETAGERGNDDGPFAIDTLSVPNLDANPWHSWMRLGGFDFFPDNPDRAAVCTWMGDVWLVDGVAGDLTRLQWRRICSGLFQPLGLKIVDGVIYVTCRDQIARLHDLNGDEEIDYVECFNNDHQVTEHFHEFAMGLQVDREGNFYYAKSARHALEAVVPHHGTLLRVSPDGSSTEIVASGFRAANGVCLNPDGTWIVTDQEGHWNPKNRINYVREGGFYGNMFGYHEVTDSSDEAMEQPLAWITNAFDRSPAELLWVPEGAGWGGLDGTLLNLSYGYGMIYTVPHEVIAGQAQGGMCAFPFERLPTGVHRGRFHPTNRQLYVAGMFAWAGSQKGDGGFYRIRATGKPALMPVSMQARGEQVSVTFSDPLPAGGAFAVTTWDLKRSARYGSDHHNERERKVSAVKIDGRTLTLTVPGLEPTWGMEIRCQLGNGEERVIHNSIHRLDDGN